MLTLNFLLTSHVIYKAVLSVQSNFFHAQTAYYSKKHGEEAKYFGHCRYCFLISFELVILFKC